MTEIAVPVDAIRAWVREVDDASDRLVETDWPTADSATMADSAVRRVLESAQLQAECARLVADLRSWTATIRVAATAYEESDLRVASVLS